MAMRAIARKKGEWVDVRVLAKHPMESGLRRGKDGKNIPAHFIETIYASLDGKEVFRGFLGPAVSKDPLVRFYIKGNKGDKLQITWKDNEGKSDSITTVIK